VGFRTADRCDKQGVFSNSAELLALATSTCVLAAMLVLGMAKGLLVRASLRHCASCGHLVRIGERCGCS
jgi:hypothetical protein